MTKATAKPLKRMVVSEVFGRGTEYVIEVTDRVLALRPKGTRRGGPAEVAVSWGALYSRLQWDAATARKKAKRRKVRR